MCNLTREQWDGLSVRLCAPFLPSEVDWRVQGRASESTGKAQCVAYIDARAVQDRLDEVVGAGNWAFDWEPVVVDKGEVQIAKGTITVYGVAKSDAGSASNFEATLGAVSHCFKRAAVQWGIGRYLYDIPSAWVPVEKNGRIPDATLRELRAKLPRPAGTPPHVRTEGTATATTADNVGAGVSTARPAGQPVPHLSAPPSPRERLRALGWTSDEAYLDEMRKIIGKKPAAGYSMADQTRWIERVAELERQAQELEQTPLAQLAGGARPN